MFKVDPDCILRNDNFIYEKQIRLLLSHLQRIGMKKNREFANFFYSKLLLVRG